MYFAAIFTTALILINLIVFTRMKPLFLPQNSYCEIHLTFDKKEGIPENIMSILDELKIDVVSENIKETGKAHHLNFVVRIPRVMTMIDLRKKLQSTIPYEEISLSENIKI